MSKRITATAVFLTAFLSFALGLLIKFGLPADSAAGAWVTNNPRMADVIVGAVAPICILLCCEVLTPRGAARLTALQARIACYRPTE